MATNNAINSSGSAILQQVRLSSNSISNTTTILELSTTPTTSNTTLLTSLSITPRSDSSTLMIEFSGPMTIPQAGNAGYYIISAGFFLFRDTTLLSSYPQCCFQYTNIEYTSSLTNIYIRKLVPTTSLGATTMGIYYALNSNLGNNGPVYVNRNQGGGTYGNSLAYSFIITELQ